MMFSLLSFLKDIVASIKVSLKLLIRDKITMFVYVLSCICFLFLCATLNFSAEDQSRIPIGLSNLDVEEETGKPTELSEEIVNGVMASTSFRVVEGSVDQLKTMLQNGEINCIFVINEGYQDNIKSGYVKEVITLYKSTGNETASMLADIFAGEMIDQICVQKSYLAYKKLDFTDYVQLSEEEYHNYVDAMKEEDEFEFAFNVELYDKNESNSSYEKLGNAVLYREIVAGIFAMLLSFVVLFSFTYVCMEKEQGILQRKRITLLSKMAGNLGIISSVLILCFILCLIFVGCVCYYADAFSGFGSLLWLSVRYTVIMSFIFMILARISKGVVGYQLIGAILILILGMLGFCTLVDGIAFKNFQNLLENTPNGWFIQKFVDIILVVNK